MCRPLVLQSSCLAFRLIRLYVLKTFPSAPGFWHKTRIYSFDEARAAIRIRTDQ